MAPNPARIATWLLAAAPTLLIAAPAVGQHRLGARATPPEVYEREPEWTPPPLRAPAPTRIDLRPMMPAVGNQGDQASCTGWAVAAVASYFEGIRRGRAPVEPDRIASPAFIYNQVNEGRDGGAWLYRALGVARDRGAAPLSTMSYSADDFSARPSVEARVEGRHRKIWSYGRLADRAQIHRALSAYQPVLVAIQTSPLFIAESNTWTVYDRRLFEAGEDRWRAAVERGEMSPEEARHRLHAAVLVGYDDEREAFLLMNSWGPEWGEGGFAWLAYQLFDEIAPRAGLFAREAWVAESSRGFHPGAQEALGAAPGWRAMGLELLAEAWQDRDDRQRWEWSVALDEWSESFDRVESVTWAISAGDESWEEVSGESPFGVGGERRAPGPVDLAAAVHFRDGSIGRAGHSLLLLEEAPRAPRIRPSDWYWGVDSLAGAEPAPLWYWQARIWNAPPDLERVVWQLPADFDEPTRSVTEPAGGFLIEGYAARPFELEATLHSELGTKSSIEGVVELFAEPVDEIRLRLLETIPELDGEGWLLGLSAYIEGPLRRRLEIRRVSYRVPDRLGGEATLERGSSWDFYLERQDLRLRPPLPRRIEVEAELEFEDGTSRVLRAGYEPSPE